MTGIKTCLAMVVLGGSCTAATDTPQLQVRPDSEVLTMAGPWQCRIAVQGMSDGQFVQVRGLSGATIGQSDTGAFVVTWPRPDAQEGIYRQLRCELCDVHGRVLETRTVLLVVSMLPRAAG
jgi:hypothetical protein